MLNQWPRLREVALFVFGVAGIINEAIFQDDVDPVLIALYAGMVGLAPFLRKDEDGQP